MFSVAFLLQELPINITVKSIFLICTLKRNKIVILNKNKVNL